MLVSNVAISVPLPGMSFRYSGRSAATGGRYSSCEGGGAIAAGGPGSFFTGSAGGWLVGGGALLSLDLLLCSQPTARDSSSTARVEVRIARTLLHAAPRRGGHACVRI